VWPELREEVELELAMMREHLVTFAPAIERSCKRAPDPIETAGFGTP
jgi:hypothetical protein